MSTQYPVGGQESKWIYLESTREQIKAHFKNAWWTCIFNNVDSFGPPISERMKQTRKRYSEGQKGYNEKQEKFLYEEWVKRTLQVRCDLLIFFPVSVLPLHVFFCLSSYRVLTNSLPRPAEKWIFWNTSCWDLGICLPRSEWEGRLPLSFPYSFSDSPRQETHKDSLPASPALPSTKGKKYSLDFFTSFLHHILVNKIFTNYHTWTSPVRRQRDCSVHGFSVNQELLWHCSTFKLLSQLTANSSRSTAYRNLSPLLFSLVVRWYYQLSTAQSSLSLTGSLCQLYLETGAQVLQ